ncbi:FtsX-like permease family protein [Streptomyces sp. SA3_actF]|uniref:FtsX-like permease family protein n=1 Tax=Streptomyces sp. SA3_actF TaxID=682181 RepID=UPI002D21A2F5|nr:FtsX-like permease family protein [Streptomyces sp. SA3_actF]
MCSYGTRCGGCWSVTPWGRRRVRRCSPPRSRPRRSRPWGSRRGRMGSLRERRSEHAVLRALGISGRKLARQTFWEQVLLVAVGLGAGLALGVVLSRWLVPLTVLTARAARPVPGVLVEMPWGRALLLLVGVAALPLLAVALLSTRRTRIADALRRLED